MTQHRSISQRLARAKSLAVKQEIALEWATAWQKEQESLLYQLGQAVKENDFDKLCIATGQLKMISQKRFEALPKVIKTMSFSEGHGNLKETDNFSVKDEKI